MIHMLPIDLLIQIICFLSHKDRYSSALVCRILAESVSDVHHRKIGTDLYSRWYFNYQTLNGVSTSISLRFNHWIDYDTGIGIQENNGGVELFSFFGKSLIIHIKDFERVQTIHHLANSKRFVVHYFAKGLFSKSLIVDYSDLTHIKQIEDPNPYNDGHMFRQTDYCRDCFPLTSSEIIPLSNFSIYQNGIRLFYNPTKLIHLADPENSRIKNDFMDVGYPYLVLPDGNVLIKTLDFMITDGEIYHNIIPSPEIEFDPFSWTDGCPYLHSFIHNGTYYLNLRYRKLYQIVRNETGWVVVLITKFTSETLVYFCQTSQSFIVWPLNSLPKTFSSLEQLQ